MRLLYLIIFILLTNCSAKQVFICGDRECVNKAEAQKYFEENFIIEVKIKDQKIDTPFDLVKLNTKENIIYTEKSKQELKKLSKKERKIIKAKLKNEKKINKILKKQKKKKGKQIVKKIDINNSVMAEKKNSSIIKDIPRKIMYRANIKDICSSLENCDIDEIAKKILEISKNKDYPNITVK